MDASGAGIHGDIVGGDQKAVPVQEGVPGGHTLEEAAGEGGYGLITVHAAGLHGLFRQGLGYDIALRPCVQKDILLSLIHI